MLILGMEHNFEAAAFKFSYILRHSSYDGSFDIPYKKLFNFAKIYLCKTS